MRTLGICLMCCGLVCGSAHAGPGAGAVNQSINTSARFAGMGDAGVGAPWGTDTNHWANPALLAFRPGVNYLHFRSELARGVVEGIVLTNDELTLGACGITLLLARGPLDGNYLDMGTQQGTDENGMSTGTFNPYLQTKSWGVGVDLVQALDLLRGREGQGLARYGSLSLGLVKHDFSTLLSPDNAIQGSTTGARGGGGSADRGLLVRLTPLPWPGSDGLLDNGTIDLVAGVAYGTALKSDTDEFIVFTDQDLSPDPLPRAFVTGRSVHLALSLAPMNRHHPRGSFRRILAEALDPILSYTRSSQLIEPGYVWREDRYVYEHDTSGDFEEEMSGHEWGLGNIFFFRRGNVKVPYGDIDGPTRGWGLNLQAGRYGGFRYDYAEVPQARGLPRVQRRGWSLWVDPVELFVR